MSIDLQPLHDLLANVAMKDRHRFGRSLAKIESRVKTSKPVSKDLERLYKQMNESSNWVITRKKNLPKIQFPEHLPVVADMDKIKQSISENQVVVIAGETGSGKTTQIPKICLELGFGTKGLIGHTQPRRVAARTVGARIAEELGTQLGSLVGYQVRFTDKSSTNTLVKLMTDGILLAEIQRDPYLNNYECIIIDEAHERSLNIDFLLGYLKQLLPRRPDLKLIITSATIDLDKFSKHFNDAPIIEVSGRTFPVETFYRAWDDFADSPIDALVSSVVDIVETEPASVQAGDILVFLAGERDIREAALALRNAQIRNLDILPLYSRLSVSDQDKIFRSGRGRRVVLATNVAETSLTVPGIGYVIDLGTARISRYSVRTKVQRLPIESISQASANQRAGRCGRIAEGICIRLYSEDDFNGRPEFTAPEILRTNLASVILQMQFLKLGNIADFPFIEPPSDKQIRDGFRLLEELSLTDENGAVSPIGKVVAQIPVDPRFARILWQGQKDNCLAEMITLISCLSIQDPRERPADKKQQADERHKLFMDKESDFNAILNMWKLFQEQKEELSNRKLDDWCRKMFLSPNRMREWREIHRQLTLVSRDRNWKINSQPGSYKDVHAALLSGFVTQIGIQQENKEFQGTRNRLFRVFPGSSLSRKPPKWIMAGQMLDTSQLFAHQVAKIDPEWLLGIADHLLQKDYYEPYYHARRGEIMARMRYSLYGLVVSDNHKVSYKSIEPELCRELFIREGLCNWKYREYRGKAAFYRHNKELCERLQSLEDRTRSRDIAVDEQQLYEFYNERIPGTVVDQAGFDQWRKIKEQEKYDYLMLDEDFLMSSVDNEKLIEFPDEMEWQGLSFHLSYKFEPGSAEDGVTLHVPVDELHQVPEYLPEWLVPGILKDKLSVMLKGLPKQYRKNIVPIPTHVEKLYPRLEADNQPLQRVLAHELKRLTGREVPENAWDEFQTDPFYLMRFSLEDSNGGVLESGRDLAELRAKYKQHAGKVAEQITNEVPEYQDSDEWVYDDIPEFVDIKRGKNLVRLWPGLIEKGELVGYQLFNDPYEALSSHKKALEKLFLLAQSQSVKYLKKELFKKADLALIGFSPITVQQVRDDILLSIARDLLPETANIRSKETFEKMVEYARGDLVKMAMEREKLCLNWAEKLRKIRVLIKGLSATFQPSISDIEQQLKSLFCDQFMYQMPSEWMKQTERFLRGIDQRITRMQGQLNRDVEQIEEMQRYQKKYEQLQDSLPVNRRHEIDSLFELRWMLEEYRISLFSQPIKTSKPVSAKRLLGLVERVEISVKTLNI